MLPDTTLFDRHGFLTNPGDWNEDLATQIAADLGIAELDERHLAVLYALRRHQARSRALPPAMHICHELNQSDDCIDDLFNGPLNAWKIAGLPDPGEEARIYLANQTPNE
jgi:tRNA 2-thiouridine synthesizing protein E